MPIGRFLRAAAGIATALLAFSANATAVHYDRPIGLQIPAAQRGARTVRASALRATYSPPLAPAGLPIRWCGGPRPAVALPPQATPVFQLVYAHPADQPDHLWRFANLLQADVSYIDRYIAAESGHLQYVRFAMGTECGPQYVSLIDWQMPQPRAAYVDAGGQPAFDAFDTDAANTFGRPTGVDTLIYIDGLVSNRSFAGDSYGGMAEGLEIADSSPGPGNLNNQGAQFAYLFGLVGGKPTPGKRHSTRRPCCTRPRTRSAPSTTTPRTRPAQSTATSRRT